MKAPDPSSYRDWSDWARALLVHIQRSKPVEMVELPEVPIAELLLIDPELREGKIAYCPDEASGACVVLSVGGSWKRLTIGGDASS